MSLELHVYNTTKNPNCWDRAIDLLQCVEQVIFSTFTAMDYGPYFGPTIGGPKRLASGPASRVGPATKHATCCE